MAERNEPSTLPLTPDRLINEVVQQAIAKGNEQMAVQVIPAAMAVGEAAYELGAGKLVNEQARALLRNAANKAPELAAKLGMREAKALLGGAGQQVATEAAEQAITQGARELAKAGLKEVAKNGARVVGGAGAIGAAAEGVVSAAVNGRRYMKGEIDGEEYAKRVGKDTAVGGACAAASTVAVIALVAATGPVSVPVGLGVSAVAGLGARWGIGRVFG